MREAAVVIISNITNGESIEWTSDLEDTDELVFDCEDQQVYFNGERSMLVVGAREPNITFPRFLPGMNILKIEVFSGSALAFYRERYE